jgi:hypothetical protein
VALFRESVTACEGVFMDTQMTWSNFVGCFDCSEYDDKIQDLNIYILALYSYPDHVTDEPHLSFELHLQNVIHAENRRAAGHLQS